MEKNDIFDLCFVDRENERKLIASFFDGPIPILILNGKSGVGKTSLLKVVKEESKEKYDFIFITKSENNKDSYLKILLNEVGLHFKKSFKQYLKDFSVAISELTIAGTKTLLNLHETYYLDHIIDALFDTKKLFFKNKMELEKRQIILDYLIAMKSKKNTVLVLDNFMYCDAQSSEIILPFLQSCQFEENLKIVIILTDEYTKYNYVDKLFTYLKIDHLVLNDLPGYEEFFVILYNRVNLSNENISLIKEIFEYCNGNPQKLKLFLTYAYQSDALDSNNKFNINAFSKSFYEYKTDKVKLKFDNLEKIIIFIIFNFKAKLDNQQIFYIISTLYPNIREDSINNKIDSLISKQIFSKEYDLQKGHEYYDFSHSTYFYLVDNLLKSKEFAQLVPSISDALLSMLNNNLDNSLNFNFTKKEFLMTKANFSYKTNNKEKYIKDIHTAGFYLSSLNQHLESSNLYILLENDYSLIKTSDRLFMAQIHYNAGKYERAYIILNGFLIESYDYYYLKANVYSILLKKEQALDYITKCEKFCTTKEQRNLVLSVKIIIFHEMPNGEAKARELFNDYVKNTSEFIPSSACILRMSEDFCSMEEAESLQKKAINLIENTTYAKLKGFFIHNLGVIYLRMNLYEKAEEYFNNAIKTLKIYMPHESSYCYNDLGLLYLIQGNYNKANQLFNEGLFWNKSTYTQIALLTNQMVCFSVLHLHENAIQNLKLIQKMIAHTYLENPDVLRKFNVNAAYVLMRFGDIKTSKKHLMDALPYIKNTGSVQKVNKMLLRIPEMKHFITKINEHIHPSNLYSTSDFDGWIVTLTHD